MGDGAGEVSPSAGGSWIDRPRNAANYRITEADQIGEGSLHRKFECNRDAIEILFALEAEKRRATDGEKQRLVKYVGWGGMPQVFAQPTEAPTWLREQQWLKQWLNNDEYVSARATVLNAHYTDPVVIRAMYDGLA